MLRLDNIQVLSLRNRFIVHQKNEKLFPLHIDFTFLNRIF